MRIKNDHELMPLVASVREFRDVPDCKETRDDRRENAMIEAKSAGHHGNNHPSQTGTPHSGEEGEREEEGRGFSI
jgi:hypothetical protein